MYFHALKFGDFCSVGGIYFCWLGMAMSRLRIAPGALDGSGLLGAATQPPPAQQTDRN